jgi:iduronate 2-sulfatase
VTFGIGLPDSVFLIYTIFMRLPLFVLVALALNLHLRAADPRNVLLICVDDLRPELGCYGSDYIRSPHIDRLASQGRIFRRHYVQSPTCGASRFAMLTGRYGPSGNEALFQRAKALEKGRQVPPSLPGHLRQSGYTTVSVGKVSHHPGGFGGEDWDNLDALEMPDAWDRTLMPCGPWKHPRGAMHGLAEGEIRGAAGTMAVFQSKDLPDTAYPDGLITESALEQIRLLAADDSKPFFLAVGLIRPHLPFGAPAKYYEPYRNVSLPPIPHRGKPEGRSTWHPSTEFRRYDLGGRDPNTDAAFATAIRKHYAACVSYADAQVGRLLEALDKSGASQRTIVILWGDHGWHLGEHAVWGKHTLFEESLRSPLVVRLPGMASPGVASDAIVETVDLFPTLCDLAGLPLPAGLAGTSLSPQLVDASTAGRDGAFSYYENSATIRTRDYRLVLHRTDGFLELYDYRSDPGETRNIAKERPEESGHLEALLKIRQGKLGK